MESWRKVWREGIVPQLSTKALEVLQNALENDDPHLIQGATTTPPPLQCVQDWPVEAACIISYCGWQGENLKTVSEVEKFFAKTCFQCDQTMQQAAACSWFLNYWDDNPRKEVVEELLHEVRCELSRREKHEHDHDKDNTTL
jgi:hypothetical protein